MIYKYVHLTARKAKRWLWLYNDIYEQIKGARCWSFLNLCHIFLDLNVTTALSLAGRDINNYTNTFSRVWECLAAPPNHARSPGESAVTQTWTRRSFGVFHSERAHLRSTVHVHPPPQASACEGGILQSSDAQPCPTSLLDYKLWSSPFPPRTCEHRVCTQIRAFPTRLHRCPPFSPCRTMSTKLLAFIALLSAFYAR